MINKEDDDDDETEKMMNRSIGHKSVLFIKM